MNLNILGWNSYSQSLKEKISDENIARIAIENRGGYLLYSKFGELMGIVQGKFMKTASVDSQYPKVGDWVEIEKLPNEQKAIIKKILPRKSKLSRKRIAKDRSEINDKQEEQIIAANVDLVFIVQSLDNDFNLQRLERYVIAAKDGGCKPVILLNKCDLAMNGQEKIAEIQNSFLQIDTFLVSAKTGFGLENVRTFINHEKSVVFVGSSGVGKSTLVNALLGLDLQKTQDVRIDDSKGRHTTTKRELFLLPSGGILIDTPGMREFALWVNQGSVVETFDDIEIYTRLCKFKNCNHIDDLGCAVLQALIDEKISRERYEDFIKLYKDSGISVRAKKIAAKKMRLDRKQTRKQVSRFVKK